MVLGTPVDCDRGVNYFSVWVHKRLIGYRVLFVEHKLNAARELIVAKIDNQWYLNDPSERMPANYCQMHTVPREL